MAPIRSWQHKLVQNKEAEKPIFSSLLPPLPPPFYVPVPIHHLYWLNILHEVQREDSFSPLESYEMQIYQLNSQQVQFEGGTRIFILHEKLFSAYTNTTLEPKFICRIN